MDECMDKDPGSQEAFLRLTAIHGCVCTCAHVYACTHTLSAKENENYPIREENPI